MTDQFSRALHADLILKRTLAKIPPSVAQSFTDEQLLALKSILVSTPVKQHTVDIRVSIPLLKCYFVLLMGKERRSAQRLRLDRASHPLPTGWNLAVIISLSLVVAISLGGLLYLPRVSLPNFESSYPTVLPWIERPEDCIGKHRTWRDGYCWDSEHSRDF